MIQWLLKLNYRDIKNKLMTTAELKQFKESEDKVGVIAHAAKFCAWSKS